MSESLIILEIKVVWSRLLVTYVMASLLSHINSPLIRSPNLDSPSQLHAPQ